MAESQAEVPEAARTRRVRRAILVVAGAGAVIVVGAVAIAFLRLNALSSEVTPVGKHYFSALLAGDGDTAYTMLCEQAQERTSPEELSHIWENARGETASFATLRGTGPDGAWPWTDSAKVGMGITAEHLHVDRYITVVKRDGEWLICPGPKTPLQGREP